MSFLSPIKPGQRVEIAMPGEIASTYAFPSARSAQTPRFAGESIPFGCFISIDSATGLVIRYKPGANDNKMPLGIALQPMGYSAPSGTPLWEEEYQYAKGDEVIFTTEMDVWGRAAVISDASAVTAASILTQKGIYIGVDTVNRGMVSLTAPITADVAKWSDLIPYWRVDRVATVHVKTKVFTGMEIPAMGVSNITATPKLMSVLTPLVKLVRQV